MPYNLKRGALGAMTGLALALAIAIAPVHGAGSGGCGSFDWPLDVEQAWFEAANHDHLTTGAAVAAPPENAIDLKLGEARSIQYVVPPTGRAKDQATPSFGGVVTFANSLKPGRYQVTLSGPGWIDVIQNGVALAPLAHTGKPDCATLRKSVQFEIGAGAFSVQLSNVPSDTITFSLRSSR